MYREATLKDSANIAALSAQVWLHNYALDGVNDAISAYVLSEFTAENIANKIKDNSYQYILCENASNLTGLVSLDYSATCPVTSKPSPELDRLYIQEPFTGKGLGRKLLDAAINTCKNAGHSKLWLTVFHKNERALAFYKRHNFKVIGETYFVLNNERHLNYVLSIDTF
ncbi:GNAT family N-acetyltransferase [Pseudoalteromonas umbrosa]|uniref:GNAT family N-acetyltransferase n=1 Tax=Pseudoalteromonas umbrosa TaxID=3048489 RepID=UPI0024C3AB93|nr:GNAT family N-acetyltransferase [Pseudoalteromonas sp. B95]MDK1286296.1 GNAT family N-acetyltransferase [Pseudoalteromonas sp. B95]